jgi:5'-phosphate synthase pdxT subunit
MNNLRTPLIGVLSIQGDVEKHIAMLNKIGARSLPVKYEEELARVDALIMPGGESTTIGKLLLRFNLFDPIKQRIMEGMPVYGTCAGMILLARRITGFDQPRFDLLDITVARNAYGPQIESFEADLDIPLLGEMPVRAVFIRAPIIEEVAEEVEVLAAFEGSPVFIRQGNILASSFHPELTDDERIHRYFTYTMVKNSPARAYSQVRRKV